MPVPALQDPRAAMGLRADVGSRRATCRPAARAHALRSPRGAHDERPCSLPRRRARRLVRGRASHRLCASWSSPLGGPIRGQDRRQCLARDLLRHPHGFPPPRRQPYARPRSRRFRPAAGRPCARGVHHDHAVQAGHHLGRATCRQPQHLRRKGSLRSVGRPSQGSLMRQDDRLAQRRQTSRPRRFTVGSHADSGRRGSGETHKPRCRIAQCSKGDCAQTGNDALPPRSSNDPPVSTWSRPASMTGRRSRPTM